MFILHFRKSGKKPNVFIWPHALFNCLKYIYCEKWHSVTKASCCRASKDQKAVLAAFEPCEAQRLTLLGNRDSLFAPLSKQHKHISLLKHPALLCFVVRSPRPPYEVFTHGYICSTVDESVSTIIRTSTLAIEAWQSVFYIRVCMM